MVVTKITINSNYIVVEIILSFVMKSPTRVIKTNDINSDSIKHILG